MPLPGQTGSLRKPPASASSLSFSLSTPPKVSVLSSFLVHGELHDRVNDVAVVLLQRVHCRRPWASRLGVGITIDTEDGIGGGAPTQRKEEKQNSSCVGERSSGGGGGDGRST